MNSKRNWVLLVDPDVYKFLAKIPRKNAERILFVLEELPTNPFTGDIQKMRGEENVWRRRIGSFRFRFEIIKKRANYPRFLY